MAYSARRGGAIFCFLAAVVIIDQGLSVVLPWISDALQFSLLNSIIIPALVIGGLLLLLWRGNDWLRWLLGIWFIYRGASALFLVSMVTYQLAKVTPAGQIDFLFEIVGSTFWLHGLSGCFYLWAGIMLHFSPSLGMFLGAREARD